MTNLLIVDAQLAAQRQRGPDAYHAGEAITLYEHQQTLAEPAYKKFLDLVGSIEYGGLDFLQGLHDRLEVELLLGHFHGAHKHLYRAAADLCESAIKERLAQQKAAAREHRQSAHAPVARPCA